MVVNTPTLGSLKVLPKNRGPATKLLVVRLADKNPNTSYGCVGVVYFNALIYEQQ